MYRPIIHFLKQWLMEEQEVSHYLLDGMPSSGKSIAMAALVHWARLSGWVVCSPHYFLWPTIASAFVAPSMGAGLGIRSEFQAIGKTVQEVRRHGQRREQGCAVDRPCTFPTQRCSQQEAHLHTTRRRTSGTPQRVPSTSSTTYWQLIGRHFRCPLFFICTLNRHVTRKA